MSDPTIATISIPSDAQFLRTVRQVVGVAAAVIPDRVHDVRLAVTEALALALADGSDRLQITIATTEDALSITVPGVEPASEPAPGEVDVFALIDALVDAAVPTPSGLVLTWVIDSQ